MSLKPVLNRLWKLSADGACQTHKTGYVGARGVGLHDWSRNVKQDTAHGSLWSVSNRA